MYFRGLLTTFIFPENFSETDLVSAIRKLAEMKFTSYFSGSHRVDPELLESLDNCVIVILKAPEIYVNPCKAKTCCACRRCITATHLHSSREALFSGDFWVWKLGVEWWHNSFLSSKISWIMKVVCFCWLRFYLRNVDLAISWKSIAFSGKKIVICHSIDIQFAYSTGCNMFLLFDFFEECSYCSFVVNGSFWVVQSFLEWRHIRWMERSLYTLQ